MTTSHSTTPLPCVAHRLPSGSWKLDAGQALSLRPPGAGVLHVTQGRVWLTMDIVRGDAQASGDLFLVPGRSLVVEAGQRLVLESAGAERDAAAWFSWTADPHAVALRRLSGVQRRWRDAVALPAHDLGVALGQACAALGRLGLGLVGLGGRSSPAALPPQRSC